MNSLKLCIASLAVGLGPHFAQVLSGAAVAFILRAFGAGLAFTLNVAIGRLLGAEGAGLYFLALSVVAISAVISKLGLDNALLRFIATARAEGDGNGLRGVFRLSMGIAASSSLAAVAVVMLLAPWLASRVFGEPALAPVLRIMSIGIFTFTLMTLLSECLKGLNRIRNSMLVSGLIYPAVALVFIWPLAEYGTSGAAMAYVLGTGVAAATGWALWRTSTKSIFARDPAFESAILMRSSRPLWVMALINQGILPWAPLFLLGILATTQEAGIYGAATRVAMLITFFLTAVNTVIAPKFAELYAKRHVDEIERLAQKFALLMTIAATPVFIVLIFAGEWVMQLFGTEFANGDHILAILAVGQFVNVATGSVGYLLMMTGHERDMKIGSFLAAGVLVGMSCILIPSLGAVGAATAASSSVVVANLYNLVLVRMRFGIWVFPK